MDDDILALVRGRVFTIDEAEKLITAIHERTIEFRLHNHDVKPQVTGWRQ